MGNFRTERSKFTGEGRTLRQSVDLAPKMERGIMVVRCDMKHDLGEQMEDVGLGFLS